MAVTGAIGTVLLFLATAIFVSTCITAPTIHGYGFVRTVGHLPNKKEQFQMILGAFGACVQEKPGADWKCTKWAIGWNIASYIEQFFGYKGEKVDQALANSTKALFMHIVTAVFAFLGFLISAFSNKFGFLFATLSAFLAFLAAIICIVVDFVIFKATVMRQKKTTTVQFMSYWGPAIWVTLVGTLLLLIAQFFTFFQCCCGRTRAQKAVDEYHKGVHYEPLPPQQNINIYH